MRDRLALKRQTALGVGAVVFLASVMFAFGAFTPGAVASLGEANGPAILVSWGFDTATDLAYVAIWLLSAGGYGSLSRWTQRERAGVRASTDRQSSDARPHSNPLPLSTARLSWPKSTGEGTRRVTAVALGLGVISTLTLLLGLAGGLNRVTAWAVLLAGVACLPWRDVRHVRPYFAARSGPFTTGTLAAAVLGGFMVPLASLPPGILWKPLDPHPYDVVSYHLQVPREWYELGRVVPLPHNAFSYFPMGQETHSLLAMHALGGPWAAMYVAQLMSVAFTGLTVLAVVGATRRWAGGALVVCVPWTLMLGTVAYVESGVTLYATLAAVWAAGPLSRYGRERIRVRAAPEDDRTSDDGRNQTVSTSHDASTRQSTVAGPHPNPLPAIPGEGTGPGEATCMTLAGLCAGLAGGIKYTALAMTALPLLVLWPVVARRWRPWAIGVAACGLAVSPWLVRNAVWAGNPVFPVATNVFGPGPFTAGQAERFRVAHAPPPAEQAITARLSAGWHRVVTDPQSAYGLTPLAVVGIALCGQSAAGPFVGGVLIAGAGVWLMGTHVMPRFLAPLTPLAALAVDSGPARRWAAIVIGLGVAATAAFGLGWTVHTAAPSIALGRQGLFRLSDLTQLLPADVQAVQKAGGRLALVGDAQAFFYPFPAGRLKYRGVFDVNLPPGATLVDGWLGEPIERLRAEGWWVQVSPAELVRLAATYRGLPPPTPPYDDPAGAAVLLSPTGENR